MTKKIIIVSLLLLTMAFPVFAQDSIVIAETDEITAKDLEIEEPNLLPDSPFYFFKEGWRKVREVFTFNRIAKIELKEKFAAERLIELQKLAVKPVRQRVLERAIERYQSEKEGLQEIIMALEENTEDNPRLNSFSEKFIHQQITHQRILEKLETQVPAEVAEKIRAQREAHLEHFQEVMLKLENKENLPEKLENALKKEKSGEFKELKQMEVLKRLEEKVPEQAKEKIMEAEARILEHFQEKLEQMPIEEQERFHQYLNQAPGEKQIQLEILENIRNGLQEGVLKQTLEQNREQVLSKLKQETRAMNCAEWDPVEIKESCAKGRIVLERDDNDCPQPRCVTSQPEETMPEKEMVCITIWDPVCSNGKTYSNACFARLAGAEIISKGVCREEEAATEQPNRTEIIEIESLRPKMYQKKND